MNRGLLVGRFQPFHLGHLGLVSEIRRGRPDAELLLVIGSAEASYTWTNPFTAGERFEMADRAIREAGVSGVPILPLADIQRHAQWVSYVESMVPRFDRVYTNNPLTRLLFETAGHPVEGTPLLHRNKFEGAHIRDCLAADRGWRPLVPPAVAEYLSELGAPARLELLRPPAAPPAGAPAP